jgi:hypothetical protein
MSTRDAKWTKISTTGCKPEHVSPFARFFIRRHAKDVRLVVHDTRYEHQVKRRLDLLAFNEHLVGLCAWMIKHVVGVDSQYTNE